jgi:hypothetical protein
LTEGSGCAFGGDVEKLKKRAGSDQNYERKAARIFTAKLTEVLGSIINSNIARLLGHVRTDFV